MIVYHKASSTKNNEWYAKISIIFSEMIKCYSSMIQILNGFIFPSLLLLSPPKFFALTFYPCLMPHTRFLISSGQNDYFWQWPPSLPRTLRPACQNVLLHAWTQHQLSLGFSVRHPKHLNATLYFFVQPFPSKT